VGANSNVARFSFVVPMQGCGTNNDADGGMKIASNVIVIQNDAVVQEIWDSAQKLNCRWTDRVTKTVSVRPLTIDMLEAVEAKFTDAKDDAVEVWMDLQKGKWPTSKSIDSAVRIGEQLSLVVGINDPSAEMDLQVRDCYAHSTPELVDPTAFRVQLTDAQGCVMKAKLLGPFAKDRATTGPYAGSLVKWSAVSAFSFPDNMQVFTSCNVEICKGACEPNPCQPEENDPSDGVLLPEADTTTVKPTTIQPVVVLFPTLAPPRTPAPTFAPVTAPVTTVRVTTTPTYTTTPPPPPPPTSPTVIRTLAPVTTPAPTQPPPPVQNEVLLPTLDYLPPSLDYLPPLPPYKQVYNPVPAASEPECEFGSNDPRCFVPAQPKVTLPPNITPPTTTLEPPPPPPVTPYVCQPGSNDARCPTSPPLPPARIPPATAPPATAPPATAPPATAPPATAPPATAPPAKIPPVTTPAAKTVNCYQGSDNPDCLDRPPKDSQYPVTLCPPGSLDPECIFVPGGSNDSPVTSATAKTTRPTTGPTPAPTKSRASTEKVATSESQKGKGSADSWKGDPSTHAFHMFHFQRGDGRRDRKVLQNKNKRSVDGSTEMAAGRMEIAQVRLTRSVRVLPAALAVEPVSTSFEYFRQPDEYQEFSGRTLSPAEDTRTFCVTTFSLAASAVLIITSLLGLITIIVFLAVKYSTASKRLNKLASRL
jgi:hypothetical protein